MLTELEPVKPIVVALFIGAAGVALMYAKDLAVRVAGAIVSTLAVMLLFGEVGLASYLLLLLLAIFLAPPRFRPLRR
jgi:hypothetical protein